MGEWTTVNLNTKCRVQLTEQGLAQYEKYWMIIAPHLGPQKPRTDSDGYSEFMLWELMNLFGPVMHIGVGVVPFKNNNLDLLLDHPENRE